MPLALHTLCCFNQAANILVRYRHFCRDRPAFGKSGYRSIGKSGCRCRRANSK
jgi:hypothetical protein